MDEEFGGKKGDDSKSHKDYMGEEEHTKVKPKKVKLKKVKRRRETKKKVEPWKPPVN